ncbi:MAG: hypothetical protein RXN88_01840 [Acidilobus sp.]|uniref:hypothetical protein n=1 Tax=Acidilobus sp. 7A TaxID=1577685 RepID=UPI000764D95C|nr:hypothetical protein [Acidilobus sp. 7A]AMD31023.1 hypothetical protein SE86_06885 [Acidilobus sp. 7A]
MSEEKPEIVKRVEAEAKVGKALKNIAMVSLRPEDLSSPASFQMAISRLYESIMKMMESGGPEQTYIAEVKFTDDLGNPVSIAIDLGKGTPPFSSQKVKAEVTIRLYEEE